MITASASSTEGIAMDSVSIRVRPTHVVLRNLSIDGQVRYEAGLSITATDFTILSSGDVTFSAGEVISLGNGFVVAPLGSFTVGTDPSLVP